MTNKEAIEILKSLPDKIIGIIMPMYEEYDYKEALDLAIKALEEYPTDKEIQDDMRRTYLGGKEE